MLLIVFMVPRLKICELKAPDILFCFLFLSIEVGTFFGKFLVIRNAQSQDQKSGSFPPPRKYDIPSELVLYYCQYRQSNVWIVCCKKLLTLIIIAWMKH